MTMPTVIIRINHFCQTTACYFLFNHDDEDFDPRKWMAYLVEGHGADVEKVFDARWSSALPSYRRKAKEGIFPATLEEIEEDLALVLSVAEEISEVDIGLLLSEAPPPIYFCRVP
ncbi:hypothetical protein HPP92_027058 [Vanilla planifolia]|uniref:Uncharacterized protein n=1 Tax=Vanilla planifolia TaxID=51239 RepID=A0A835U6F3_VANPL|nr:hypothetical protein HPP92_027058 [Vanilla planifolia]